MSRDTGAPMPPPGSDWKSKFVNDADEAFKHELVKNVLAEFIDNMSSQTDLASGLPSYGLHKVMHYVAVVARAQALGFDPNMLKLTPAEATEEQLKLVAMAAWSGVPVTVIQTRKEAE